MITIDFKIYLDKVLHSINHKYDSIFAKRPEFIAKSFDFPVGKPSAKGYYNAQAFTKNTIMLKKKYLVGFIRDGC